MELCVFSKHLQQLSFSELGRALRGIGVTGVDLTVRPQGHIEPEAVRDRLPEAAEALRAEGVTIRMLTTAVTDANAPHARAVFETAARLGIRYLKLGYFPYRGLGTLRAALADAKARLKDLAALAAERGVFAGCHNHSGPNIGANLVHLRELIEDLDPRHIGIYLDPAHAFVEGMYRGWLQALDDVADRVRMLAVKDMAIRPGDDFPAVPMGQGVVRWAEVIPALKTIAPQLGPVSIHAEVGLPLAETLRLAADETAYFRRLWES